MNLSDLYELGERSFLKDQQKRNLVHTAYWLGVCLAKINGCPETSAADNRVLELAFLQGFMENRKYHEEGVR